MATSSEAVRSASQFCAQRALQCPPVIKTSLLSGHPAVDGVWLVMFEDAESAANPPPTCPPNTIVIHVGADGSASQWDVPHATRSAQELQEQLLDQLLGQSSVDSSSDAEGLLPVRGRKVEVRGVVPGVMQTLDTRDPTGTVMLRGGTYYVFIDEQAIEQQAPNESGRRAKRFVILHEYVHVEEGDVFEERPWPTIRRKYFDKIGYDRSEKVANGRAAMRLADEFAAAGNTAQAEALRAAIRSHGWLTS